MATITTQAQVTADRLPFKNGEITVEHIIPSPAEPNIPLPPPSKSPVDILDLDKGTPDNHVPRDPRLIRLTGVHPFNVEPPLTALYNEGKLAIPS
jgi:nitrate reductase (NAD(P)H)